MSVLSRSETNLRAAFHNSTDFDLHSGRGWLDVDDDTNNFAVIEINNVVRFENFLHFRCVDSEIVCVRRLVVLSGDKINDGSSSDFHLVICIHYFRDSNFSSSKLNHEPTRFMWSQSLSLLKFIYKFHILFKSSMT